MMKVHHLSFRHIVIASPFFFGWSRLPQVYKKRTKRCPSSGLGGEKGETVGIITFVDEYMEESD